MGLETPLITAAQLRASLTPEVYLAIFDDDRTGDIDSVDVSDGVLEVLNDAHALTISSLGPLYARLPTSSDAKVSILLKAAEKQWARAFAFERRPEFEHEYGYGGEKSKAESRAKRILDEIRADLMQIVDAPPEPQPRNVGGIIRRRVQRVFLDGPNGERNSGDF